MTARNDGGPAHPASFHLRHEGMSLRDWFAAQALVGLLASPHTRTDHSLETYAHDAYDIADAMLAAREAKP